MPLKVAQASSSNGESVGSKDHDVCYNILAVNIETQNCLTLHVVANSFTANDSQGLNEKQLSELGLFKKQLGPKEALIIQRGKGRYNFSDLGHLNGMQVVELIVPTNGLRWNMQFDPPDRRLTVSDEEGKQLYCEVVSNPYIEVPAAEQELSDDQRLAVKLHKYTYPNTGELEPFAIEQLRRTLAGDRPSDDLGSQLLHSFLNERARKAGYPNYCYYFEAGSTNSVAVDLNSPELVLRKIIGVSDYIHQKFKKMASIDLEKALITPESVVDLLKDHFDVVQILVGKLETQKSNSINVERSLHKNILLSLQVSCG